MTISQLAKATGFPVSTIRFYERRGLLRPAGRSSGNYRLYGRGAGERLTFIRAAQAAGFELPEIKALLANAQASAARTGSSEGRASLHGEAGRRALRGGGSVRPAEMVAALRSGESLVVLSRCGGDRIGRQVLARRPARRQTNPERLWFAAQS